MLFWVMCAAVFIPAIVLGIVGVLTWVDCNDDEDDEQ